MLVKTRARMVEQRRTENQKHEERAIFENKNKKNKNRVETRDLKKEEQYKNENNKRNFTILKNKKKLLKIHSKEQE